MNKFIVATKNQGKLIEIKEILKKLNFEVVSMEEIGFTKDIEETGDTFEENALIKAKEINRISGEFVMADDSGLLVEYLNFAPGVHTSRFAGENASDLDKINKLLKLLEGVPFEKRKARFVCVIAVVFPKGKSFTVKGILDGYISNEPRGSNGFGYDPIFIIPEFNMTTAEMKSEEKHKISHRGIALEKMVYELEKQILEQKI